MYSAYKDIPIIFRSIRSRFLGHIPSGSIRRWKMARLKMRNIQIMSLNSIKIISKNADDFFKIRIGYDIIYG